MYDPRPVTPAAVEAEERARHVSRMYQEAEDALLWRDRVRIGIAATLAVAAFLACLWTLHDCGNVPDAAADPAPDAEAFALSRAALTWQPEAESRAETVHAVAVEVVDACREIVGDRWGDNCPSLLMALSWRESRWRPGVTGRAPWRAVGLYQLHGAALDTFTRDEARDIRRNTRLATDWLVQCDRACVGLDDALVMYATGTCDGDRRARWGARRLLRLARELDELLRRAPRVAVAGGAG